VSSILKALKKLDDDLPRKRRSVIWPSGSRSRKGVRRWDISGGRSAAVLWGLLAVAVVAAAGGLFLYLKPVSNSRIETTAAVTRPISKPDQTSSVPKPAAKPPVRPPAKKPAKTAEPQPVRQPLPAVPFPKTVPSLAVKKKPAPPARRPSSEKKKTAKPSVPATTSFPILTSELKLQAISWAPAPGDRLAVINGNIVREGASLEGYVIVKIDKEEVAVRKGSERWKLVFDLK